MGEMLKQKNLEVTDYYSQPTGSMVASAADVLLARFASHLDVGDAITRTLPAKFACIGCPANAVDPAKRDQIEHRVGWLTEQRAEAMRLGLPLEVATLERQMRDCHTMLREMEQIEQYRKDEAHGTFIAFDTIG